MNTAGIDQSVGAVAGQSLWWVGCTHRQQSHATTVVGVEGDVCRLSNGHSIDRFTLHGTLNPVPLGRCYASREAYEASCRLLDEWARLTRDVGCLPLPGGVDFATIAKIRAMLGMR
ncbi:hypothetical protein KW835_13395 [Acidovorax sp. sic0104]|nr:hypothetical protein [Acidovorax sp. sic0104]